ncbi:MAG: hypothetical protein H6Q04_213, partial [Acidobacteria bacterium]|nr:hypothetical protein [Acidobacteriota bacterium]
VAGLGFSFAFSVALFFRAATLAIETPLNYL